MKFASKGKGTAERVSTTVFYALIALSVLMFGLFYTVGYDRPYIENPDFNAPVMTDAVIVLMCLLVIAASCVAAFSVVRSIKNGRKEMRVVNGIPASRISFGIVGGVFVLLLLTYMLGSSSPMTVNGKEYADVFWLKTSEMFINTSVSLIVLAAGAVLFGFTRSYRKDRNR